MDEVDVRKGVRGCPVVPGFAHAYAHILYSFDRATIQLKAERRLEYITRSFKCSKDAHLTILAIETAIGIKPLIIYGSAAFNPCGFVSEGALLACAAYCVLSGRTLGHFVRHSEALGAATAFGILPACTLHGDKGTVLAYVASCKHNNGK